ncbi:uncharacterized protein EDB93DRAFT_654346 [Suillus bovinus]|uniref:uncharacterized protein n=1 Tax=Suillus bovinus TaxID=48563 RepID=UPI001B878A66|nr:uncharacterized protein EDB93DRAFT_654346 [Suillus bovinus]KAG2158214.1 hypothetical protein EDB93DRAFT_654346 [Suillus bovinus]
MMLKPHCLSLFAALLSRFRKMSMVFVCFIYLWNRALQELAWLWNRGSDTVTCEITRIAGSAVGPGDFHEYW